MVDDMIARLGDHVNEPYRQDEVLAACRGLAEPFILREVVGATGLPTHVCHRVLGRLVKKGVFARIKVKTALNHVTGGRWGKLKFRPGGAQHRVYAYRFAKPAE